MAQPTKSRSKLKYVWIGAALAALAIILSPISPFETKPQAQVGSPSKTVSTATLAPAPAPQPTNMTDADLALCSSLTTTVATTMGSQANSTAGSNLTRTQIASNLLAGEACNRPSLLSEVANSSDSGTTLVAYGCDASAGQIGDAALQTDLAMFKSAYCDAATFAIQNSASSLTSNVAAFQSSTNNTSIQAQLGSVTQMANNATQNISPGSMYADAQLLDKASTTFTNLVQKSAQ